MNIAINTIRQRSGHALTDFNLQVLQIQDDAYTLAYYLLGNEERAIQAVQAAVQAAYSLYTRGRNGCRWLILGQVVKHCQGQSPRSFSANPDPILMSLASLQDAERQVVVLVDILGFHYNQAAGVLARQVGEIIRLLAQGRRKIQ